MPETKPIDVMTFSLAALDAVAFRVKDVADGWILCSSLNGAKAWTTEGNLIQPLFTEDKLTKVRIETLREVYNRISFEGEYHGDMLRSWLRDLINDETRNLPVV